MKWLNGYRMRLVLVGFVAVMVVGGGSSKADFTFGEPTNLGPMVNGSEYDDKLCIPADGLSLYFTSDRRKDGYGYDDIWFSTRPTTDDPWGPAENLGPVINTELGEWHASISTDGLELYFERWEFGPGTTYYIFNIWVAKRVDKDSAWGQPEKLDIAVPEGFMMVGSPSLSGDGLELYLGAYKFGDEPQSQLYVVKRQTTDAPWGEPTSLGPVVNSWSCQAMPTISHDGLLLLFNDWWAGPSRPGGYGNGDVWFTRRATKDAEWSEPVNLGPAINTAFYDLSGAVSIDGSTLYFSSDRPFGLGNDDIWQAPIIPIVDLNGDGIVDTADMCIMVDHWGTDNSLCDIGPMPWGDGGVDVEDLIVFIKYWEQENMPEDLQDN